MICVRPGKTIRAEEERKWGEKKRSHVYMYEEMKCRLCEFGTAPATLLPPCCVSLSSAQLLTLTGALAF